HWRVSSGCPAVAGPSLTPRELRRQSFGPRSVQIADHHAGASLQERFAVPPTKQPGTTRDQHHPPVQTEQVGCVVYRLVFRQLSHPRVISSTSRESCRSIVRPSTDERSAASAIDRIAAPCSPSISGPPVPSPRTQSTKCRSSLRYI